VVSGEQIIAMGNLALQVPIASHVNEYVARLIIATHPESPQATDRVRRYVRYGSSPRGGQAIILGAKVNALLEGRYNVAFDDVYAIAPSALRHRLLLNFEGQAEGITTDDIIADLLEQTPTGS
jgi:MoxR-like ATPase